jgi:hypothetical protein
VYYEKVGKQNESNRMQEFLIVYILIVFLVSLAANCLVGRKAEPPIFLVALSGEVKTGEIQTQLCAMPVPVKENLDYARQ